MIVVKLGGSLYDHPGLGPGLRQWVENLTPPVLLVPGGGKFADAVRELDRVHSLGEETSHWLALRSVTLAAAFVMTRLPGSVLVARPGTSFRLGVLDGHAFGKLDQGFSESLPHSWDATTDSLAARAAATFRADRLVLLKSVDIPTGTSWTEAVERGWVDSHFTRVVEAGDYAVETLNFRMWLDDRAKLPWEREG